MTMRQKGSILNRRNALAEILMQQGMPGSQSGAQVGPQHPMDGMFMNALAQPPQQGQQGAQSGMADYNYINPISTFLETYLRYQNGIPSPDAPEWVFDQARRKRGY